MLHCSMASKLLYLERDASPVQGILAVADAVKAADMGVEGIMVSNHGGRQLDFAPAAIDMLPDIAKAVKGRGVTLLVDGGIRRGTDIIKASSIPSIFTCYLR